MLSKLRVPKGTGFFYGDEEYNSKRFLNRIVLRDYLPVIKPKKRNPRGFGAGVRNEIYDEEIYKERSVCEDSLLGW